MASEWLVVASRTLLTYPRLTGRTWVFTAGEDERVFVACVGRPVDGWDGAFEEAHELLMEWSIKGQKNFSPKQHVHMRGEFPQVTVGITFGGGRTYVGNYALGGHSEMVNKLINNSAFRRMAQFASGESIFTLTSSSRSYNPLSYVQRFRQPSVLTLP